ncbi:hypothetical protein H1C71_019092, partial [Ictidomys tridecemlineatus]
MRLLPSSPRVLPLSLRERKLEEQGECRPLRMCPQHGKLRPEPWRLHGQPGRGHLRVQSALLKAGARSLHPATFKANLVFSCFLQNSQVSLSIHPCSQRCTVRMGERWCSRCSHRALGSGHSSW